MSIVIQSDEVYIKQGRAEQVELSILDGDGAVYDLSSGYGARMQVRRSVRSHNYEDELLSGTGRIVLLDGSGDEAVNVQLNWTQEETEAIVSTNRPPEEIVPLLADLEIYTTADDQVVESVRIPINFEQEVTRDEGVLSGVGYWLVS